MSTSMLLIIILGLIVTLTSVCDSCDIGTSEVDDFDWNMYSGPRPWYVLLHSPNDSENDLSCVVVTYGRPEGNTSLITVDAYSTSKQGYFAEYANGTNWDSTGWEETYIPPSIWNGRNYVIAIDYRRYVIAKHCSSDPNKPRVYVSFRSQHPDEETREEVLNEMEENNIDISQQVEFQTDHCQLAEPSTKKRSA